MSLQIHHNPAIQPPRPRLPIPTHPPLTQQQRSLDPRLVDGAQLRNDALLVERRVGGPDAAEEVGFQVADGEGRGDEVEGCGGGEAGAVFGEEVEGRGPVWFVGGWGGEVEGEEDVVDGGVCIFGCTCGWCRGGGLVGCCWGVGGWGCDEDLVAVSGGTRQRGGLFLGRPMLVNE
ncbi:hypothetical protein IAQ61_009165 [Plenodomus lingam]|uniref:uncharacterized protein n=1 Tax=Leptosphaeria maculans TaxID=5022 RepID=UPI00331877EC|nr:hypothetical protein IAQ61_009165 [Plenodomus lingam]